MYTDQPKHLNHWQVKWTTKWSSLYNAMICWEILVNNNPTFTSCLNIVADQHSTPPTHTSKTLPDSISLSEQDNAPHKMAKPALLVFLKRFLRCWPGLQTPQTLIWLSINGMLWTSTIQRGPTPQPTAFRHYRTPVHNPMSQSFVGTMRGTMDLMWLNSVYKDIVIK